MKKIHYAWWIMVAGCVVNTCTGFVMISGGNFFRPVAEDLGVGVGRLMIYITIASLTMSALFPTAGKLLGKHLKLVLLAGGLLQYIPFGLLYFASDLMHFYIVGLFVGIGSSVTMFMAVPILINMWFIEKKGFAMGIAMAFSGVAGMIGSIIVGYTIPLLGWRVSYLILAAIGLGIYVPAMLFLVRTPQEKNMQPYGADVVRQNATQTVKPMLVKKDLSPSAINFALASMMLMAMMLAAAAAENGQVATFSIGHFGMTAGMAATMVSCFALGGMIGKIIFGVLDDRFGHVPAFLFGIILIVLSQLMLLLNDKDTTFAFIAVFISGIAMAVYGVLPPLMTGEVFGQKEYNKYWAYIMSAGCFAGAFAAPLYGTIFDVTGNYTAVFLLILTLGLAGGLFGLLALRVRKMADKTANK